MIEFLKKLYEPIRLGNEYRLEKYGPSNGMEKSATKSRQTYRDYRENNLPKMNTMTSEEIDLFKSRFQYWSEWTGARFAVRENPILNNPHDKRADKISIGTTCRVNPVTGEWKAI